MVEGFKLLFKKSAPRLPQRLQTDAGLEFLNKEVQALFKQKKIQHFYSSSDKKAAVFERFNRTIKSRIWTYFTADQTDKYLDILPKLTDAYNCRGTRVREVARSRLRSLAQQFALCQP